MEENERTLLDDLIDAEDKLTAWEMDFVELLDGRRDRDLTVGQLDKLNQIAERCGVGAA